MPKSSTIILLLATALTGCVHAPVSHEADDHYYRVISFPSVALKADPLERIESVEVVMHCGRFMAINHIPDDWSVKLVSPVSE